MTESRPLTQWPEEFNYSLEHQPLPPNDLGTLNMARWLLTFLPCDQREDLQLAARVFADALENSGRVRRVDYGDFLTLACVKSIIYLDEHGIDPLDHYSEFLARVGLGGGRR